MTSTEERRPTHAGETGPLQTHANPAPVQRSPVAHMDNLALAAVIASDVADLAKWRYLEFFNRTHSRALAVLVKCSLARWVLSRVKFRARMYALRPELTWLGPAHEWSERLFCRQGVEAADGVFNTCGTVSDTHAVFGPYLPLDRGEWRLHFKVEAEGGDDPEGALVVDVTQAGARLERRLYSRAELDGREHTLRFLTLSDVLYDIGGKIDLLNVETRFAPRRGASMRMWDVRVEPVQQAETR